MIPFLRKLHFWLGVVLGLQFAVWTTSGVVMSALDHHEVMRGPATAGEAPPLPARMIEPTAFSGDARSVELAPVAGRWVYRVQRAAGSELRDAQSGEVVALTSAIVARIAAGSVDADADAVEVERLTAPIPELRDFEGPVFLAHFPDKAAVVVDANDGRVRAVRTQAWRIFDVAFMLHTMDYTRRGNFNSAWVVVAAATAFWLVLSGLILVARDLVRGGYSVRKPARR